MTKKPYEFAISEDNKTTPQDSNSQHYEFAVDEAPSLPPEAISGHHRLPEQIDYSGLTLEALPIKGLKGLGYSVLALLLLTSGWQAYALIEAAIQWHWLAGASIIGLSTIIVGYCGRVIVSLLSQRSTLADIDRLQATAQSLSNDQNIAQHGLFINELQRFYKDKPQAAALQTCIDNMPDYLSDKEAIAYIDKVFLAPLDTEAEKRISQYCLQTGVAVAASPWPSVDMLLALWRSLKMVEDIGQLYGIRPSKANRFKLIKQVINHMTLVGSSEIIIDRALEELSLQSLVAKASAQIGQGLGAATYCGRIGLTAMAFSRPIPRGEKTRLNKLLRPLAQQLTGLFKPKDHFSQPR